MAASYLKDAGYQILARNYRVASGEIDLIVSKDGYLIFVEVKYRSNSRYGSPEAAEAALSRFAQSALTQQMVAGRIISREESVTQSEDKYLLEGTYACVEMIGRVRREQIGDTNGKSG